MPLRAGGTGPHTMARWAQSKTNGPGDCGASAVQVMVMPKTTMLSEPP